MNNATLRAAASTSNVQNYFAKHQALTAAVVDLDQAVGKDWSLGRGVVTRLTNQLQALQQDFSKADWADFKLLQIAMIKDQNADA